MLRRAPLLACMTAATVLATTGTAVADHTSGTSPLSPLAPSPSSPAQTSGEGSWTFLGNIGPMQGSDLEFFTRDGVTYMSAGTLGQAPTGVPAHVGQRIVQLTDERGRFVPPRFIADHGSAHCAASTSTTGLQHDVQAVPVEQVELLVDTTDATGRCHDTAGGGLELIDVTGLGEKGFEPDEISLIRLDGLSHTVTADQDRPGILYNNTSDFSGRPWIDVVDARSCLGLEGLSQEQKRTACDPRVYRLPLDPAWTSNDRTTEPSAATAAACHDTTYAGGRLHCAGLDGTIVLDVTTLFGRDGRLQGSPLPCVYGGDRQPGTQTGALVTDCSTAQLAKTADLPVLAYDEARVYVGGVNHPGRECVGSVTTCNTNLRVPSREGVAVSHEADPTPDGEHLLVTDERGGGIVPPGATCAPGLDNPYGNGGIHVFDTTTQEFEYARMQDGRKAVWIGGSPTPSPVFCTVHVIEQVPGEARIVAAYYDGGTKIVDYSIDGDGRWTFDEVASLRLPGANTWASEVFKVVPNADGTNTYYFASTSFALGEGTARGVDVFAWRGEPNLLQDAIVGYGERGKGAAPVEGGKGKGKRAKDDSALLGLPLGGPGSPLEGPDAALLALALVLLPGAALVRRATRSRPALA